MSVRVDHAGVIRLEGDCPIEDAETLLAARLGARDASVDWSDCDSAHAAVIQVLLADKTPLIGTPKGDFLRGVIAPLVLNGPG